MIGEFAYLKMIATLTLKRLNEKRKMLNLPPVAEEPILQEFENIEYCRLIFNVTCSYRAFIKAFISVNSMSLVAWPVGQHNDHFSKDGKSLENKITFVVHSVNKSIGRGGSLFGRGYVFALLDWSFGSRTDRGFYVAHAEEMGIGPVQPRNAQRLLTAFFATAEGAICHPVYHCFRGRAQRNRRARGRTRARTRRTGLIKQHI